MMIKEPYLATSTLLELIRRKPEYIWIMSIAFEACKISTMDILRPEFQMLKVMQAYPSLYVPSHRLVFRTPLMTDVSSVDKDWMYDTFVQELSQADKMCNSFDLMLDGYEGSLLVDKPITDRMFIKKIQLAVLPVDEPRYHTRPYYPYVGPDGEEDTFYDGIKCAIVDFGGTYQLLGPGVQTTRDSWLPGHKKKPMILQKIQIVKTKHVRNLLGKRMVRCYHRGKDDIYVEYYEYLIDHPERVSALIPNFVDAGLLQWTEIEGEKRVIEKFVAERINLLVSVEQEEEHDFI